MKDDKYKKIREDCIFASHVLHVMTCKLREKYQIPARGQDYLEWLQKNKIARLPEVQNIASQLGIDPINLQHFIVTGSRDSLTSTLLSTPEESNRERGVFSPINNEIPLGTYIKVTVNSTKNDVADKLRLAKMLIKLSPNKEKKHRAQVTKLDQKNMEYYQSVEKNITVLVEEKQKWQEEYGKYMDKLVQLSIEQTAGEFLEKKYGDNDNLITEKEELKLRTLIHDRYYDFIKRFRLPTIRESSKLLRDTGL